MKTMRLYHVSKHNLGRHPILTPRVPEHVAHNEDNHTPRVCACASIIGCLRSIGDPFQIIVSIGDIKPVNTLWVYCANIPIEDIKQPSIDEVPDVWTTGEFWITKKHQFWLMDEYRIMKHARIIGTPYSRWILHSTTEDEIVVDRVIAPPVYGEITSFSVLDMDCENLELDANNVVFSDDRRFNKKGVL